MALAPQFATHRIGSPQALHTLELYLDLICPFSAKLLTGLREHGKVIPLIESSPDVASSLQLVIRQVPQPWHASSTIVHEAALAVSKSVAEPGDVKSYGKPEVISLFQKFFFKLMDEQKSFYDEPTSAETPNQTRERLAVLAESVGVDKAKFLAAIKVGKSNGGTPVTNDLKLHVKYQRQNSVHVTPTVALDGIIDNSVSSSFTGEQWTQYLTEKILPPGSKL
ncbi:thioredoxin-like fold domain protein [Pseudohyphozyma bogoriensis]|nr:thioredoxin-like fold domain protein [Pseudohyphozyma bogoriensis]